MNSTLETAEQTAQQTYVPQFSATENGYSFNTIATVLAGFTFNDEGERSKTSISAEFTSEGKLANNVPVILRIPNPVLFAKLKKTSIENGTPITAMDILGLPKVNVYHTISQTFIEYASVAGEPVTNEYLFKKFVGTHVWAFENIQEHKAGTNKTAEMLAYAKKSGRDKRKDFSKTFKKDTYIPSFIS